MKKSYIKSVLLVFSMLLVVGCSSSSDVDTTSPSESILSQALKDEITFMYSEESLAHDVYLALNQIHPSNTLYNIATNSEVKHIEAVNDLAVAYDLNMTKYPDTEIPYSISGITSGVYPIERIQELYSLLYEKGIQSEKDAVEVGCIVEVIDVEDLDEAIALAEGDNASDVLSVFNFLQKGSYTHYWAFDKSLKNMGVTDGCCAVPDMLGYNFCHPEYPQK